MHSQYPMTTRSEAEDASAPGTLTHGEAAPELAQDTAPSPCEAAEEATHETEGDASREEATHEGPAEDQPIAPGDLTARSGAEQKAAAQLARSPDRQLARSFVQFAQLRPSFWPHRQRKRLRPYRLPRWMRLRWPRRRLCLRAPAAAEKLCSALRWDVQVSCYVHCIVLVLLVYIASVQFVEV